MRRRYDLNFHYNVSEFYLGCASAMMSGLLPDLICYTKPQNPIQYKRPRATRMVERKLITRKHFVVIVITTPVLQMAACTVS
jgi:hypothetical protein